MGKEYGVGSSLQIVIDSKCHAVAFTKLREHVVARISNRYPLRLDHFTQRGPLD